MEVVRFRVHRLPNEAHVSYHREILETLVKYGINVLAVVAGVYANYLAAHTKLKTLLDQYKLSLITKKIARQDKERDDIFFGFANAVKSSLNHPDRAMRPLAEAVDTILNTYGWLSRRTLAQGTAAYDDIIDECRTKLSSQLAALGLMFWVDSLEAENILFKQYVADRTAELAQRPTMRMPVARKIVDQFYRIIINFLEAASELSSPSPYDDCISEINIINKRYMQYEISRSKDDDSEDEEETEEPEEETEETEEETNEETNEEQTT